MARCPHELERVLIRRKNHPHHPRHCSWGPEEVEVTRKTVVTPTPRRICRSCCRCSCSGYSWDLCQSPATVNPRLDHAISDPTYCKLHTWFTRYDKTKRGFLDLHELGCLLHHKGASLPVHQLRRLFDEADADNDGRLSFEDFVHMWHQAAVHEEEFLAATDCQCLVDIARTYDLHPRIFCHHCDYEHDGIEADVIQRVTYREMADDPSGCSCGSGNTLEPFVRPGVDAASSEKRTSQKHDEDKHFVFSSNRNSLSPSEYK